MNRIAPTLQQNQDDRSSQPLQIQHLQEELAEKSRLLLQAQQRITELEAEQDFLKTIISYLPTPVFVKEAQELRFVLWNKASEALFGFQQEVILGKNDHDLFPPHEADFFTDNDRIVLAGNQMLDIPEEPIHTVHQGVRWLHTRKIPVHDAEGRSEYLLGISEDITERKRTEEIMSKHNRLATFAGDIGLVLTQSATLPEMLQKSTEIMVTHLNAAFARIWTYNSAENVLELRASAGKYTHINGGHARVPVGQFKIGLIAQERQPHLTNDVLNDPRVGDKEWARREGMVAFAGYPLIVEDHLVGVMAIFAGQVLGEDVLQAMQSVANMIALSIERKQNEEALRTNENFLQNVLDNTPASIYVLDTRGRFMLINEVFAQLFQVDKTVAVGKTNFDLFGQEAAKELKRTDLEILRRGIPVEVEEQVQQSGGMQTYLTHKFPLHDINGVPYALAGVSLNITERKKAEETMAKRAAELACLNDIGRELEISPPIPELLEWVTGRIPPVMQYPPLCRVAIEYEGQVYGVPEAVNLPAQMTHGLYIGGEVKGRIYLAYIEKHDFLNEESALLGGIATRLSSYLENRRLFEQIQARVQREQRLREVTTRIRESVDVDTVMRTVAREVGQALGRPAFIYLGHNPSGPETPPFAQKEEA